MMVGRVLLFSDCPCSGAIIIKLQGCKSLPLIEKIWKIVQFKSTTCFIPNHQAKFIQGDLSFVGHVWFVSEFLFSPSLLRLEESFQKIRGFTFFRTLKDLEHILGGFKDNFTIIWNQAKNELKLFKWLRFLKTNLQAMLGVGYITEKFHRNSPKAKICLLFNPHKGLVGINVMQILWILNKLAKET